ncbi:MAG TPA: sugar transferase [Bacteroidota bacterium]|nr:sugar transferase [Bacteroidota bacterium]
MNDESEIIKTKLHRNWRSIYIAIAMGTDILSIAMCVIAATILRKLFPNILPYSSEYFCELGVYFCIVIMGVAALLGVYRASFHSNLQQQYYLMGKAYILSALIILSSLSIFCYSWYPRRFTLLFLIIVPFALIVSRIFLFRFNEVMQRRGYGRHNSLLLGYDSAEMNIIHRFQNFPELGYDIKGIITSKNIPLSSVEIHGTMVPRFPLSEIEPVIFLNHIDRIFIPSSSLVVNGYSSVLEICRRQQVKLKILSMESDRLLKLAKVFDIAGITLHTTDRTHIEFIRNRMKRLFDLVVAGTMLFLTSPILILTAIAIMIESGCPFFFKQTRASLKNGKTFEFYKFRSMVLNADELKETLFEQNESDGALFKMKDDPRITRVGKFIRKFSIDELPQFINVIKGDMSIVGPRPLPISDFEKVDEPEEYWDLIKERERTKPGITGLWQVSGRSGIGFKEMIWLDLYYAENHSLLFDLEILFATIPVVLFGKGAY